MFNMFNMFNKQLRENLKQEEEQVNECGSQIHTDIGQEFIFGEVRKLPKEEGQADEPSKSKYFPHINQQRIQKQEIRENKKKFQLPIIKSQKVEIEDNRNTLLNKNIFPHFEEVEDNKSQIIKEDKKELKDQNISQNLKDTEQVQTFSSIKDSINIFQPQLLGQHSNQVKDKVENIQIHFKAEAASQKLEQSQKQKQQQSQITSLKTQFIKITNTEYQHVCTLDPVSKSPTIILNSSNSATQSALYFQNKKIALTVPITSLNSGCKFIVCNLKYCIGFGIGLKQVLERHQFDYKSEGSSQLAHGLYLITSQGYSWSHSEKQQDDILRTGFNYMYNGLMVDVKLSGEQLSFRWKKGEFVLTIPEHIRNKYTLCYCMYLHEKDDSLSLYE